MNRTLKIGGSILSLTAMVAFAGLGIADEMSGMSHNNKTVQKSDSKTITITGNVIDSGCYIGNDNDKDTDSADCSKMCIQSGIPAGIATSSGKFYIVLGENQKSPANVVKGFEGKRVKVTGKVVVKGGCNFITVSKIAEVKTDTAKKTDSNNSKEMKTDSMK